MAVIINTPNLRNTKCKKNANKLMLKRQSQPKMWMHINASRQIVIRARKSSRVQKDEL